MKITSLSSFFVVSLHFLFYSLAAIAQGDQPKLYWSKQGNAYYYLDKGNIVQATLPGNNRKVIVSQAQLTLKDEPLVISSISFSADEHKILLFTNTKKVWRLHTRGDYYLYDKVKNTFIQVGKTRPASSLMFAKLSPDGQKVAFVSENNLFVEDLSNAEIKQVTADGTRRLVNGTFDWAYEEEFFCRDGFRWSPDGKKIAFWQIDATKVKDYLMVNNLDSIYPYAQPVEYPVAGETPSPYRIGVVDIGSGITRWINIPGDPKQHYVPRMEWTVQTNELIIQQINRKQNESRLYLCNVSSGMSKLIYSEKDEAWIDILPLWDNDYTFGGWD